MDDQNAMSSGDAREQLNREATVVVETVKIAPETDTQQLSAPAGDSLSCSWGQLLQKTGDSDHSEFYNAAMDFDYDKFIRLLKQSPPGGISNKLNETICIEMVQKVVSLNSFEQEFDRTPFNQILSLLTRHGYDINYADQLGLTPLHYAAMTPGSGEIIKEIHSAGAKLNVQDKYLQTPLHKAVMKRCIQNTKNLLELGARLCIQDRTGKSPLHLASQGKRQQKIIRLLIRHRSHAKNDDLEASLDEPECPQIPILTVTGPMEPTGCTTPTTLDLKGNVQRKIKKLKFQFDKLNTSKFHRQESSEFFVTVNEDKNEFDINERDSAEKTPLHLASKAGRLDNVVELLQGGADINLLDNSGQTALHFAASHDLTGKIVEVLLKHRADINMQDNLYRETALHKAVKHRMVENMRVLVKHKASPNCQDLLGDTPLHKASHISDLFFWSSLMSLGASISIKNDEGKSPELKALQAKNATALAVMRQYVQEATPFLAPLAK